MSGCVSRLPHECMNPFTTVQSMISGTESQTPSKAPDARLAGIPIEYEPAEKPWGVRRFFVRDPFDKLVNILSHA